MKIISILTQKGGVGKTTTSIHLGASFAEMGKKVLLIDFDSQKNLSQGYKIPDNYPYTIKNVLLGEGNFRMTQRGENIFIIAGDDNLEQQLYKYKKNILKERLEVISNNFKFDYCIIDCPPRPLMDNLTLGEIALLASDYVISPILAEEYSINGIKKLFPSIIKITKENPKLKFLGFFFNQVLTNTRNFKEYMELAKEESADYFFKSFIRQDINIENAKKQGKTIFEISPKSRASIDFKNLVKEIMNKIG
ncbi:ParA family protein [Riemerella anatipestifer]|nr:ParA family protein [Riemerella anatipestifer]